VTLQKQKSMKNTNKNNQNEPHIPVLLEPTLHLLNPQKGESYLDLTAGYGGHATAIIGRTFQPEKATLVDRDQNAIAHLKNKFSEEAVQIIHQDFLGATKALHAEKKQFDIILADLGVSSPHLDTASRGFSLRADGPLDMRMDERQSLTADEIVNSYSAEELTTLLRQYGEEPKASRIARLITEHRPIKTTHALAALVAQAWPGYSKVHPATRTFQALRIAVNSELEQLRLALPIWVDLLSPGGRIAIISFHSLEDRLVKQGLAEFAGDRYDAPLQLLVKQPAVGSPEEIVFNPRARSAKLRAAVKK
jgi:16S rRNA (cytosine1402-N4)-methyltransferase